VLTPLNVLFKNGVPINRWDILFQMDLERVFFVWVDFFHFIVVVVGRISSKIDIRPTG